MIRGEVHVWLLYLDRAIVPPEHLNQTLSMPEQQRAARYHQPQTGGRYALLHYHLRQLLAHYCHIPADQLRFDVGEYGKPVLRGHRLHFNISRSGPLGLMAFGSHGALGIDIECHQTDMEHASIGRSYFSGDERSTLSRAEPHQKARTFYQIWTRKEAYLKALGTGLSRPLESFSVCSPAGLHPAVVDDHDDRTAKDRWQLQDLNIAPNVSAALAAPSPSLRCQLFALPASQVARTA